MTFLEIVADIRKEFKNDKIISVKDYKEIIYTLNKPTITSVKKDVTTQGDNMYKPYILSIVKSLPSNKIYFQFMDLENKTEKSYIANRNDIFFN